MWFRRECRRVETLLWTMEKGTADSRQTTRVQAHLRQCPACRAQWQTYQQTQAGLVALRERPVPASQTGWHTVQARLAASSGVPAATRNTRGELAGYRTAFAGRRALLTSAASLLALCFLLNRPDVPPHEAHPSLQNEKLAVTKGAQSLRPLKPQSQFAAFTTWGAMPASAHAFSTGLSGVDWNGERDERRGNRTPHIRRSPARPYDRRTAMAGAGRRRSAPALLHRHVIQPKQTAPDWNNADEETAASGLAVTVQVEGMTPEYVLTTAENAASAPRSFIMDSINMDAQRTGQANVDGLAVPAPPDDAKRSIKNGLNSRQNDIYNNVPVLRAGAQAVKEIQAW